MGDELRKDATKHVKYDVRVISIDSQDTILCVWEIIVSIAENESGTGLLLDVIFDRAMSS